MRKGKKITLIVLAVLLIAVCSAGVLFAKRPSALKDKIWMYSHVYLERLNGKPYMEITRPKSKTLTNQLLQDTIEAKLNKQKTKADYTLEKPLMVVSPYGTSSTAMYTYFKDAEAASVEYTCYTKDYGEFTQTMHNSSTEKGTFEGQIFGLMDDRKNTLKIRTLDADGNVLKEKKFKFIMPHYGNDKQQQLEIVEQKNMEQLSNGLYVSFGFDRIDTNHHNLLMWDNNGVLRNEIPMEVSNGDVNIRFVDDCMVYTYKDNLFIKVNSLGKIVNSWSIGEYTVHHDFDFDGDHTLYALVDKEGEDTVEDLVLALDLNTGEYHEAVDFKNILPDIYERATLPKDKDKLDWIHFNTVDFVEGGDMLLSSRELSSIIYVSDIAENPQIKYMIADENIWKDTQYTDLVLEKKGDFNNQFGQHTVTYLADDSLPDGQYYVYCYNNNSTFSSTWPAYDWTIYSNTGFPQKPADNSFCYKYLVDENEGTYELADSVPLVYSMVVSSTQYMDNGNLVTCSGMGTPYQAIQEFDAEGNELSRFNMNVGVYTYRTLKFTFEDFWF